MRRAASIGVATAMALVASTAASGPFTYKQPGDLIQSSGDGRVDSTVYAPGMRFPMEEGPAFANSQVYNPGGYLGPAGGQCDAVNYDYPWRDNYCEIRQWDMPLCPAGTGHQGQDIRTSTCDKDVHWVVAVADGTITSIGSYTVYLTADDGTRFDYLHMGSVQVSEGQDVVRGQRVGKVSNEFGGTATTIHLHFNILQYVGGVGTVFVPPYMSLVQAYQTLIAPPSAALKGVLDAADCTRIDGWAQDPDAADQPISVNLSFDGVPGELDAQEVTLLADLHREDLCSAIGSCEHGFASEMPVSLRDGEAHTVHAYGLNATMGASGELESSPKTFTCALDVPAGVRRLVRDYPSFLAWHFSAFWDVATLDDAALAAIPEDAILPPAPALVRGDDGSTEVWLVDGAYRRLVASPEIAAAWELDFAAAETWPAAELSALNEGKVLRARPFLVKAAGPAVYLIDDAQQGGAAGGGLSGAGGGDSGGAADSDASAGCDCGLVGGGASKRSLAEGLVVTVAIGTMLGRRRRRGR